MESIALKQRKSEILFARTTAARMRHYQQAAKKHNGNLSDMIIVALDRWTQFEQ